MFASAESVGDPFVTVGASPKTLLFATGIASIKSFKILPWEASKTSPGATVVKLFWISESLRMSLDSVLSMMSILPAPSTEKSVISLFTTRWSNPCLNERCFAFWSYYVSSAGSPRWSGRCHCRTKRPPATNFQSPERQAAPGCLRWKWSWSKWPRHPVHSMRWFQVPDRLII